MKFIVDAQLSSRLANMLIAEGHDAVHTLSLKSGNRTSDVEVNSIADADDRIVVTKDSDFVDSQLLKGSPRRLFLIATGNLKNAELESLLRPRLWALEEAFKKSDFVEMTRSAFIIH